MELIELKTIPEHCRQLAEAGGVFLQDPHWGEFQTSLGKRVRSFIVQESDGSIALFAQTIEHAIGGKCFLFAPYGPVFPQNLSVDESKQVFEFFSSELPKLVSGLMFLRFEPEASVFEGVQSRIKKTIDLNPHQTLLLDIRKPQEELLAEMKPKTRYNIRLAEKSGIKVRVLQQLPVPSTGGEDPIAASAKRAGIQAYTPEYFNQLLNFFSKSKEYGSIQARCYAAYHQSDLLAVTIMLEYAGRATYLFGGALELKRNLMPSYLLHWQAIQDAKARGIETYDFWGVEIDENHPWYGFSKFKLGFGGEVIKRPGTLDFTYNPTWYNAYAIFRKLNRLRRLHFRN